MIRRLAIVSAWLILGHAVAAGLFWLLLQVPESSSLTLAASAVAAITAILVLAWTVGGALRAWRLESSPGHAALGGIAALPAVLLGAAAFALVWWLTERATSWNVAYAGQIDAWIIARTGKSDTARLHTAIFALLWFLRWGLGLTLSLSLAAWAVRDGVRTVASRRWLTSAMNPLRWLAVTTLVAFGIALPWHYVYWRPAELSIVVEPYFVAAKLGTLLVIATIAWALTLRVVTPPTREP